MNLVRPERGLSKTESRFPAKGTCLSIYSRCVNAESELEEVLGASYPWCAGWAAELKLMTLAAIDRLVHHSTILEMNVESYRRREAIDRKRGRGRPPAHATIKKTEIAGETD
jgi:hypothetical protein